jgi:hypothetical protein
MSRTESLKHIGIRFFWFLFFSGIIVATCIVVENNAPHQYSYSDAGFNWNYTPVELQAAGNNISLDQHSHTTYSGADLTPEQNVLWHISMGYNACIITDHDTIEGAIVAQQFARTYYNDVIKVIVGMEWSTDRIHLNFLNVSVAIPNPSDNPTDQQIQDVIDACHAQGGLVVANHYPRTLLNSADHPTRKELLDWGVDYFEIYNGITYDEESDLNWCNNTGGFASITGTDMHSPRTVNAWTGLNASEFTEAAIFNELLNNNTAIFYNAIGAADHSVTELTLPYRLLEPLIKIGQLFKPYQLEDDSYDWIGIGIFVSYLAGVFVISEFIRFGNKKFWEKREKRN